MKLSKSPLKIGIAGLGNVGTGVVQLLTVNEKILCARAGRPLQVVAVSARNRSKDRGIQTADLTWYENAVDLADDSNVDVIVEVMGGSEGAAFDLVKKALQAGKPVVSANKALIATHAAEIIDWQKNGTPFLYEAAVAGGIPVIKTLREGLAANEISAISGILNGTCNFILTEMAATGRDFADVLKEAQDLGYAEADPGFDVDGIDAAHKLSILLGLAFGVLPDKNNVTAKSIRTVSAADIAAAKAYGYQIKLICLARKTEQGITATVEPSLLPFTSSFATVNGAQNAVRISGSHAGHIFLSGAGAGGAPTASAVVADLVDIARGAHLPLLGMSADHAVTYKAGQSEGNANYLLSFATAADVSSAQQSLQEKQIIVRKLISGHHALIAENTNPSSLAALQAMAHIYRVEDSL